MKKHNIFETNPNLKEVHMTSDGESFYNDNDAKLHAKSLKDKTVELVVNPSQLEVITDEDEDFDEIKTGEGSGEENTAIVAEADGSVNELNDEAPEDEAPEVEAPEVEAPEVEAPEVETPEVEAPEVEAPEVETPEVETPEVEAKKITPKKGK
jgi:hypothetical protein